MGVVVRETTRETRIATERVTANSLKEAADYSPIKSSGVNTATSEILIESTVKPISLAPSNAACRGFIPCSRWRVTFSITTIASSTTKPVEIVRAINDRLSRL